MTFDYSDQFDGRVEGVPPYLLTYPDDVEKAPDKAGVYIFFDAANEVIYVGQASGERLRDEIRAKKGTPAEKDAVRYRWFRTNTAAAAKALESDWIRKYQPKNNARGK